MEPTLALPQQVHHRLISLADLDHDVAGVLFCTPHSGKLFVDAFLATGIWLPGGGRCAPDAFANTYLEDAPDGRVIDFHTHGAYARRHRTILGRRFSGTDEEYFKRRVRREPHYMHLLVTPFTLLAQNHGPVPVIVSPDHSPYAATARRQVKELAAEFGYSLTPD